MDAKKSFRKPNNFLLISQPCKNIKNASTLPHHSQFQLTHTSHVSFTTVGHKLLERRFSLSTNRRFEGYAHVGDAVPHTPLKHINLLHFQHHNIANKATIALNIHTPNPLIPNPNSRSSHSTRHARRLRTQGIVINKYTQTNQQ